jgi:hypothetical protein
MTIESQAQSKPATNKPLPKTQADMLAKFARVPHLNIANDGKSAATCRALHTKGLIVKVDGANAGYTRYALAPIATEEAASEETATPQRNRQLIMGRDGYPVGILDTDASEDELPAKMPLAPLMDEDTAPVMDVVTVEPEGHECSNCGPRWQSPDYSACPRCGYGPTTPVIGDTVRYHNNTDNTVKQYFSGTIIDAKKSIILNSIMYRVQPDADDRLAYLGAVWIMPYQLEGQAHLDHVYDQLPALREIEKAYLAWEAAFLAGRFEEAARLDMIHRKLEDEHNERLYGPRFGHAIKAPTPPSNTPHNGTPAPVDDVQAFSANLDQKAPQNAFSSRKGIIIAFDGTKGRIGSQGEIYAFNTHNLKHAGMSVKTGDSVTFEPRPSLSFERAGMPGAALIVVDGYVAPERPAYTPNASITNAAKEAEQARKGKKQEQRIFRQQQADKNAASMKRVMGGGL